MNRIPTLALPDDASTRCLHESGPAEDYGRRSKPDTRSSSTPLQQILGIRRSTKETGKATLGQGSESMRGFAVAGAAAAAAAAAAAELLLAAEVLPFAASGGLGKW